MRAFEPQDSAAGPSEFWDPLAEAVTTQVRLALGLSEQRRRPIAAYLRDLEQVARRENAGAAVLQVISSARRLLGDRSEVEPAPPPFVA